jgi:hypothetical protein
MTAASCKIGIQGDALLERHSFMAISSKSLPPNTIFGLGECVPVDQLIKNLATVKATSTALLLDSYVVRSSVLLKKESRRGLLQGKLPEVS